VPAAILTATIRASVRMEAHRSANLPAGDFMAAVNRWTCRDATNNMFVTMVFAAYDPELRVIEYTNAGHCFPLLFKASGECRTLEVGGCFLGIMEQVDYETERLTLEPGDTLVFYTDGVTDTQNQQDQIFSSERLTEVIRANLHLSAEELRDEIYEATLQFRGEREQFDDLTLLVMKL
jgi:sigma-B regulation protein RsbU (phosphoserine phosphatase)